VRVWRALLLRDDSLAPLESVEAVPNLLARPHAYMHP